jgi:hypothetical protein
MPALNAEVSRREGIVPTCHDSGTKYHASRCEFAKQASGLGALCGLLFAASEEEDVSFFFVLGFVTDA